MSQDQQPVPLEPVPLDTGTPFPGAWDHAWIVEGMDQQWGLALGGDQITTWIIRARCTHCGVRARFCADDMPPCRPPGAQP